MRFGYRVAVDCEDVGSRVTVRVRLTDGALSDVLGVLEGCDDAIYDIRVRNGELRRVARADVVAAKVVPDTR